MLLCGRIFLGARFPLCVLSSNLGAQRLLNDAPRWSLSFPNFDVVPRALGEFDGVM